MEKSEMGGYSKTKPANKEVQDICYEVKLEVERITGQDYKVFTATLYRDQIVAGKNFLIKVHVGGTEYIHIIVYVNLEGNKKVTGVQENHTKDDPLEPFS